MTHKKPFTVTTDKKPYEDFEGYVQWSDTLNKWVASCVHDPSIGIRFTQEIYDDFVTRKDISLEEEIMDWLILQYENVSELRNSK